MTNQKPTFCSNIFAEDNTINMCFILYVNFAQHIIFFLSVFALGIGACPPSPIAVGEGVVLSAVPTLLGPAPITHAAPCASLKKRFKKKFTVMNWMKKKDRNSEMPK